VRRVCGAESEPRVECCPKVGGDAPPCWSRAAGAARRCAVERGTALGARGLPGVSAGGHGVPTSSGSREGASRGVLGAVVLGRGARGRPRWFPGATGGRAVLRPLAAGRPWCDGQGRPGRCRFHGRRCRAAVLLSVTSGVALSAATAPVAQGEA